MEFEQLALNRESTRKYNDLQLDEKELIDAARIATLAPSACNGQPYKIHLITNNDLLKEIKGACQAFKFNGFINEANALYVIEQIKGNKAEEIGSKFYKNDFMSIDIGIYGAYLVLALEDKGIKSCILGAINSKKLAQILKIDDENKIRLVICAGYSDSTKPRNKKRKDIDDVLFLNK